MPDYGNQVKLDFSIFKNTFAKSNKHPGMTGVIEFYTAFSQGFGRRSEDGCNAEGKGCSLGACWSGQWQALSVHEA